MTKYPLRCIFGFHMWRKYNMYVNNICWEKRTCNMYDKYQWRFEGERKWHEN